MTILELRFPAGRFHATPWGRHVNEGAVEWPPSPWRLLRSLLATWHLKARPSLGQDAVAPLMASLAAHPPRFFLPQAACGHTRHYLPVIEGRNEKTTKVFDTFIQVGPGDPILVEWPVSLPEDQLGTLRSLAALMGYFGRAESIVEARLREDIAQIKANSIPLAGEAEAPPGQDIIRVLAPLTPLEYEAWKAGFLARNEPAAGIPARKRGRKTGVGPGIPASLFEALQADSGTLQAAGWSLPPGAAVVSYTRPPDIFSPSARVPRLRAQPPPTTARYALSSAVLPAITSCLAVAERVHDALCKWSDQGAGSASVFTGIGPDGRPLAGHQHVHVFCETSGDGAAITHLTVWSPAGFDAEACLALRRLSKVWGHGGHDLHLVLHGLGQPADFSGCAILGEARVWRSLTPFVSTRHAKAFRDGRPKIDPASGWQVGSPAHDLLRLVGLAHPGLGVCLQPRRAITLGGPEGRRALRCLQFQTARHRGGGSRGQGEGAAFTMEFPSAVRGPLAFGYGAHFGLGLFAPVAGEEAPGDPAMPAGCPPIEDVL